MGTKTKRSSKLKKKVAVAIPVAPVAPVPTTFSSVDTVTTPIVVTTPQSTALKIKDALTGNDNSLEFILVGAGLALLVGLALSVYDVVKLLHAFDWEKFGNGLGWLFGGTGLGYGGKKWGDKQPTATPDTTATDTTATPADQPPG